MSPNTLVLLSGGVDSAATLALYHRRRTVVSTVFVDYGQAAVEPERAAAERVAAHYGVTHSIIRSEGVGTFGAGYVRGRNALLLQLAFAAAPFEAGQIAMGLHAGTSYVDSTPSFVLEMQRIFDLYSAGQIRVVAPFIDQGKPEVVSFCRLASVPLTLTYSCELGSKVACGECLSCRDRKALDVH